MKKTQKQRVEAKLLRDGSVTRNQCLSTFPAITRLSAIILTLREEGWDFDTKDTGKDYIYTLKKTPYKTQTIHLANGETITRIQK